VTSHSFRKTVADLIGDDGLFAWVGADQLGHAKVSMTQDKCMSGGRTHAALAELLDRTINDQQTMSRTTFWCPHQGSNLGPADYR
jgi:integrase